MSICNVSKSFFGNKGKLIKGKGQLVSDYYNIVFEKIYLFKVIIINVDIVLVKMSS